MRRRETLLAPSNDAIRNTNVYLERPSAHRGHFGSLGTFTATAFPSLHHIFYTTEQGHDFRVKCISSLLQTACAKPTFNKQLARRHFGRPTGEYLDNDNDGNGGSDCCGDNESALTKDVWSFEEIDEWP